MASQSNLMGEDNLEWGNLSKSSFCNWVFARLIIKLKRIEWKKESPYVVDEAYN